MAHSETNQRIEVTFEKLIYGGDGLARLDGRVVLAPFVLPGERVAVETMEDKAGLLRSKVIEVREASADRVEPRCPYFGSCGGCHYQHAAYEMQLALKREILAETLRRIGKLKPPEDIRVIAAEPWQYRNRAQFHIRGTELGYLEARSNRLRAIEQCPISSPRINRAIVTLRGMLRDPRWPRFVRSLEVFTNEEQLQLNVLETDRPVARRFFDWCAAEMPELVPGALDYPAAGCAYRVSGGSFFQVNRHLIERMVEAVVEDAEGVSALELYAGVGLFSVSLARRLGQVTAVEASAGAVRDLQFNAERAGVKIEAHRASTADFLAKATVAPDFVLADPPRSGLGKATVSHLARLGPQRITVVACDPATLARDLAGLVAGGYWLDTLTMIDLFPQTYHIEAIAQLRK
ncbi:MAG TPA: class I SAM-dependent RNA methyltransferase [Bryobacteraceae bacterium]|nr:class I SAM-dependent RNA methyltransferase [Bryobacteraceae bacterium]